MIRSGDRSSPSCIRLTRSPSTFSAPRRVVLGGVPPVAFLAGCRVDAFVDDRVVAIAALDEVSPHDDAFRLLVTVGVVWCAGLIRHR